MKSFLSEMRTTRMNKCCNVPAAGQIWDVMPIDDLQVLNAKQKKRSDWFVLNDLTEEYGRRTIGNMETELGRYQRLK